MKIGIGTRVLALGLLLTSLCGVAQARRNEALTEIFESVEQDHEAGRASLIVMDLDETTVNSIPRRFVALRGSLAKVCGTAVDAVCAALDQVTFEEMDSQENRYDIKETARRKGLSGEEPRIAEIERELVALYLSGRFESLDREVPGAGAYVRALRRAGARVVFVSSRFDDVQRLGTLASLRTLGLVRGAGDERDVLLRRRGEASIDFKRRAFAAIASEVERSEGLAVRGVFENEPENMQAMVEAFPEARAVFVEGAHMKAGEVPEVAARIWAYR